jgi:hypothetical protein
MLISDEQIKKRIDVIGDREGITILIMGKPVIILSVFETFRMDRFMTEALFTHLRAAGFRSIEASKRKEEEKK